MILSRLFGQYPALAIYIGIVLVAVVIDLATDRSGGAISIATLPIALVAASYFLAGQIKAGVERRRQFVSWLLGALLVFLGLVVFAARGGDASKDGELIFTYAMLLVAPPASLLLPFSPLNSTGHALNDVLLRSLSGWIFCIVLGVIQWFAVRWLSAKLRNRSAS